MALDQSWSGRSASPSELLPGKWPGFSVRIEHRWTLHDGLGRLALLGFLEANRTQGSSADHGGNALHCHALRWPRFRAPLFQETNRTGHVSKALPGGLVFWELLAFEKNARMIVQPEREDS